MKKFYIVFIAAFIITLTDINTSSAQWHVEEGFNDTAVWHSDSYTAIPPYWTSANGWTCGGNWKRGHSTGGASNSKTGYLKLNYKEPIGDHFLVTPQFTVSNGDSLYFFTKKLSNGPGNANDRLHVKISTNTNSNSDFTDNLFSMSDDDFETTFTEYAISLKDYIGQSVYVAFVGHKTTKGEYDQSTMEMDAALKYFDDVRIGHIPAGSMVFESSTCTQNTDDTYPKQTNQQIIGIEVNIIGSELPALNATSFDFSTSGTTTDADINNAKLYYTAAGNSFSSATLIGTQNAPSGTFSITGSQELISGTNYFWLAYDISENAIAGNVLDASCTSVTVNDTARTPTTTNPTGSREIKNLSLLKDIELVAWTAPSSGTSLTDTETVKVVIKNNGSESQSGFSISYSTNNGTTFTTETFNGSIEPNTELIYSFTTKKDFHHSKSHKCIASVSLNDDIDNSNDSVSINILQFTTEPILNGNFNNWTDGEPDEWKSNNDVYSTVGNWIGIEEDTIGYSGSAAHIRMEKLLNFAIVWGSLEYEEAFTSKPDSIACYYKGYFAPGDQGFIYAQLLDSTSSIIGEAALSLDQTTSSYIRTAARFTYYNNEKAVDTLKLTVMPTSLSSPTDTNDISLDEISLIYTTPTIAVADFTIDNTTNIKTGDSITVTDNSTDANSYNWYFGQGSSILSSVAHGPHTFTYNTDGDKNIILTIKDINGNSYIKTTNLDVVVKINEKSVNLNQLFMYPNPTNGNLNFSLKNNDSAHLEIYDITGRIIMTKTVNKKDENINLQEFNNGIYFIKIHTKENAYSGKIILQKQQ